jgi:hypothetical protein
MRRRRYLQTAGLALTGGLAGCSDLGMGDDATSTPTATDTPTPTEEPTPTDEPTPREEPPNVDPPLWFKLLPRDHLDNEGEYSKAAVFHRVDWEWYLGMRSTIPEWGPAGDQIWSFKPTRANLKIVPSTDILKTPQWGAWLATFSVEANVFRFPNLGPEMERQCGLAVEEGERETARVDDVVTYSNPHVTIFVGADTDAVHEALADNKRNEADNAPVTEYFGYEDAASRNIYVSEAWSRGVVAVETGDEDAEDLLPMVQRIAGGHEGVAAEASVRWCLGQAVTGAPVVTGEVNGSRYQFAEQGRSDRGVERVEPFDTLVTTMNAREYTGTVQHVFSRTDGDAPTSEALEESFELESGTWSTAYHPSVSTIEATW